MINQESIKKVESSTFSKCFRKPLYDSYCFSRIPATISYLLTGKSEEEALPSSCYEKEGEPYDAVCLLFLDAFGWRFFERYKDHPFLKRFEKEGIVSKITTQFPSTTAAHVTTVHTGLNVGESGIYEWFQHEPLTGRIITPLLFSFAGESISQALIGAGYDPREIFPFTTVYESLHKEGVDSYVFQEKGLSASPYSQAVTTGAHPVSYIRLPQGLQSLGELLQEESEKPLYSFLYYGHIDSVGHRKGVDSAGFDKIIKQTLDRLENELIPRIQKSEKKIALLVTADHGMVEVTPGAGTFYLNKELPEVNEWIQLGKRGTQLVPAGSSRDMFFHIKEGFLEKAKREIQSVIKDRGEVWEVKDLIEQGFFADVSDRFLERVGNLVILPYEGEAVWWYEEHKFKQNFFGAHGGLTPHEMESIFLFLNKDKSS